MVFTLPLDATINTFSYQLPPFTVPSNYVESTPQKPAVPLQKKNSTAKKNDAANKSLAGKKIAKKLVTMPGIFETTTKTLGGKPNAVARLLPGHLRLIFTMLRDDCPLIGTAWMPWYKISHVCQHWREVALRTDYLWTHPPTSLQNWTSTMLERSVKAPLVYRISRCPIPKAHYPGSAPLFTVVYNIHRIKKLSLEMGFAETFELQSNLNRRKAGRPAPLLEELIMTCYDHPIDLKPNTIRKTPRLRKVSLVDFHVDWTSPFLSNLTDLRVRCNYTLTSREAPSWQHILDAFRRMPWLEILHLHVPLPDTETTLAQQGTSIRLPRLRVLSLGCVHAFQIRSFLSLVEFPPLEDMSFSCLNHDDDTDDYSSTLQAIRRGYGSEMSSLRIFLPGCVPSGDDGYLFDCFDGDSSSAWHVLLPTRRDLTDERVIADALCNLNLSHLMDIQVIGFLDPGTMRRLFGRLPHLEALTVSANTTLNLVEALQIPAYVLPGSFIFFPALTSITLRDVVVEDMPKDLIPMVLQSFIEGLSRRHTYRVPVPRLNVVRCCNLFPAFMQKIREIGLEVAWDGKFTGGDDVF